jgi:hypothetical protein
VLGAGVPTQGTSYWGHPLGESNAPPGLLLVASVVADEESFSVLAAHMPSHVHLLVHCALVHVRARTSY